MNGSNSFSETLLLGSGQFSLKELLKEPHSVAAFFCTGRRAYEEMFSFFYSYNPYMQPWRCIRSRAFNACAGFSC